MTVLLLVFLAGMLVGGTVGFVLTAVLAMGHIEDEVDRTMRR
jgi:hypothetical protein